MEEEQVYKQTTIQEHLCISEQLGDAIIESIIELGGEILYDHYLEMKSQPYTETQMFSLLSGVCEHDNLRYENDDDQNWGEGKEPVPSIIDTWARSTLQIKKKVKMVAKITESEKPPSIRSKASNMSLIRRGMSRQGDRKDIARQNTITSQGRQSVISSQKESKNQAQLEPLEEIDILIQQDPKHEIDEEEESLRNQLEKEIKRKKDEEQRIKNRIKQEEERKIKIQKIQQELKSKEYTFDHNGNIIYSSRVNTEKLVPDKYPIKFDFFQGNLNDSKTQTAIKGKRGALGSSKSARIIPGEKRPQTMQQNSQKSNVVLDSMGQSSKGKKAPQREVDFVRMVKSQSQPVAKEVDMQVHVFDQIMLNPGISMREAGKYKTGPTFEKADKMTLQEYQVLVESKLALPPAKLTMIALEASISESQEQVQKLPSAKNL